MRRSLVVTLAAQLAILGVVAGPRLLVRVTGDEYRLRVRPVDPIDPFRGAYVSLDYVGFDESVPRSGDGDVYVVLRRDGDAWVGGSIVATRPESGPYVACHYDGDLDCGIESWFASQERAREAERLLAGGAIVRVRIDGRGRAVLVGPVPETFPR